MDIVERLTRIAKANFDANKRAGRKGPEWALRNEVTQVAATLITTLRQRCEALEAEREAAREFVKRHPSLTLIDLAEFESFLKIPAAMDAALRKVGL